MPREEVMEGSLVLLGLLAEGSVVFLVLLFAVSAFRADGLGLGKRVPVLARAADEGHCLRVDLAALVGPGGEMVVFAKDVFAEFARVGMGERFQWIERGVLFGKFCGFDRVGLGGTRLWSKARSRTHLETNRN